MPFVNSVLGPLDLARLGVTLMHEHILSSSIAVPRDYPELLDQDYMDRIVSGLSEAKGWGISTIVDATTPDLGREVNVLAKAALATGVNIIACTGWWLEKTRFTSAPIDRLALGFIRDIEQGISGTDIKAGILKGASDVAGVLPDEEIVLRAVARAHLQTNVPIMLHSYSPGQVGRRQLTILREEGVDLRRVKMDHSNDTTDLEYLLWLLEQGCYLGVDRYPGENGASPLARTKTLKALLDAGYGARVCVSHDWSLARMVAPGNPFGTPEKRAKMNPHGLLYVANVVFPQLREMGVDEGVLRSLLVDGPRNFFGGV